eukprot:3604111-Amphidinium_carterae.1
MHLNLLCSRLRAHSVHAACKIAPKQRGCNAMHIKLPTHSMQANVPARLPGGSLVLRTWATPKQPRNTS